ncbi:hypothetical protein RHAB21_01229 [Pseudorhizobium halotolerans]|uniref:Uncharacterized protein n=1 Tax=Pseudorhizobium halotolerans TaxID=1233081 RepID=A0ABM8PEY6_9HYPH|nr:hypothetical protein [Pseudorhizobium halotolerans]CAD7026060.1 hypothetical protein RHAB21_01229 [Pseudorhizobium halotolerans]
MLESLPPPPRNDHPNNDMWIDEQIWGHRLWDATSPWLIFLEFLGVAEAKERDQLLLDDRGEKYPLRFKPAQRMYIRNILYNNEPLLRIADEGLADSASWEKWLTAMSDRAQGVPVRDFTYLRKRFNSFADFVALVSMLRGTTIENGSNKRWSSRFVFPFGRHALYEDLNVKNNSTSREYINFGLPGELVYQMLCRSDLAGELAPEIAKMLDGDPCDRLLGLLEPDYEEDKSTRGNSYLPYIRHETFDDLARDWLALLRGPLPRFDTYPHLAALTALHLLRYQLVVAAEHCYAPKPHFVCEIIAPKRTPVRELSISNFQMNDTLPSRAVDAYIDAIGRSDEWQRRQRGETPFPDCRRLLVDTVRWPDDDDYSGPPDETALLQDLKRSAQARHRQHVAAVHRSYGTGAGLVSRRGTSQLRYAPTDALLKSLILANVQNRMDYSEFLDLLYRRYGFVIGEREAIQVLSDDEFDRKSFQLNSGRLERRLRTLGMLRRLSDACAYVENPLSLRM